MMSPSLQFLDSIWQGLFVGTLIATLLLAVMTIGISLHTKISPPAMKRFLNGHWILLAGFFFASFVLALNSQAQWVQVCLQTLAAKTPSLLLTRWLAGLWMMGALGALVFEGLRMWQGLRQAKDFHALPEQSAQDSGAVLRLARTQDSQLHDLVKGLANDFGLRKPIQIYRTKSGSSPFVWGLFQHRLVIPEIVLRTFPASDLKHVLAHELIHIQDRDSLWMSLELVLRRILFFHPLIHVLRSPYATLVEKNADQLAVQKAGLNPRHFAETLLKLGQMTPHPTPLPYQLNASRGYHEIRERMLSLKRSKRSSKSATSLLILLGLGSFLVSTFHMESAIAGLGRSPDPSSLICLQVNSAKTSFENYLNSWLDAGTPEIKCEKDKAP